MDGKTILLVEDDKALAMGTVFVLEAEGYTVRHAVNIKTAGTMLDDAVDLILLDVMLPDGSGYDFCRSVRDRGIQIPIIFLTAMSEEVNIVQGLELGADDFAQSFLDFAVDPDIFNTVFSHDITSSLSGTISVPLP